MNNSSKLVPVRVDVVSDDKSIRIVETLLLDPTCMPIPLSIPLSVSIEQNVKHIAYTLLSEAETNGMGRTVRHFTGRLDLFSPPLLYKLEYQLRSQLWKMMDGSLPKPRTPKAVSLRLVLHGVVIEEDFFWDPNVPVSPMDFAQDLAKELKLPDEAVVAILTSMIEQIYGLTVDVSMDRSIPPNQIQKGVWMMDSKEYITTMAHIVAQHRPHQEHKY
jgi:hypothetical protein